MESRLHFRCIHVFYFSCSLVDFVERSLDMYRVSLYTWLPDFICVVSFWILMHDLGNEVGKLHTKNEVSMASI